METNSLCWACIHSVPNGKDRGCPWSIGFRPVEGWTIETRTVRDINLTVVRNCPSFVVHPDSLPDERWASVEQLSEELEIPINTLKLWSTRSAVPMLNPFGDYIYLKREALLAYAFNRQKELFALAEWLKTHNYINGTQAALALDISTNELHRILTTHKIAGVKKKHRYRIKIKALFRIRKLVLEERYGKDYYKRL